MFQEIIKEDIPDWLTLPELYKQLCKEKKVKYLPWYLFSRDRLLYRLEGLKQRYPNRDYFPFARHDYTDDVACWDKARPGKVLIVHDFASEGWEAREVFDSFEDWLQYMINAQEPENYPD